MKKRRRIATPASAPAAASSPKALPAPFKASRLGWIVAGLCLAVAVGVRLFVFLDVRSLPDVTSDGLFYQDIAQRIADGTYWKDAGVFTFSPLYVFYLAAVRLVAGGGLNAVRLSQLAIGLCSIGLLFLLARAVLSRRAALVALCIASVYVPFVFFEVQILGITLVLALMLLSLVLLVTAIRRGSRLLLALSGWTLGLASLGAPNLILMTAPLALWLLLFAAQSPEMPLSGWRGWKPGRGDVVRAAIFVAAVGVGILPVTIWNYRASGQLIPISSQGGINFFIGNNPQATGYFTAPPGMQDSLVGINIEDSKKIAEAETGRSLSINQVSAYWFGKGLHFLFSDPAASSLLMLRKTALYLNRYEIPLDVDFDSFKTYSAALRLPLAGFGVVAVLGLAGLIVACRSFGRHALLILAFATYSATVVAFFVSDRYRLPAVPFLILFSALAIDWLCDRLRSRQFATAVLCAALLMPIGFFVYHPVGFEASPSSLHFNLAMNYLKQKDLPRARAELERCIKADPSWLEARYDLAAIDHDLHDDESAWVQLALLDSVRNVAVLYLRGQIDADGGLLASAQENFRAVLALDPNHAGARQRLAAVEARVAAETPEARSERARRLQQDIMHRQKSGQHERAIANLVELRDGRFEGVDPAFIGTAIGFEYTQLGRFDEAEKAFEAALLLSPGNPLIHKNLAIVEVRRGDRAKAQSHFQEFSRLAPGDPQVAMVRDMIAKMP